VAIVYSIVTPTSKPLGKRASAMVESLDDLSVDGFDASTTKDPKLVRVKIAPKDWGLLQDCGVVVLGMIVNIASYIIFSLI